MGIVKKLPVSEDGRRQLEVLSPANYESVGVIDVTTPEEVKSALERARKAQASWAKLSFKERGKYMLKALDVLVKDMDEFSQVILGETPKPYSEVLMLDLFTSADSLLYYAKNAEKYLKPQRVSGHGIMGMSKRLEIHYQPRGVIGIVSPWNAPFILSLNPTIQSLMAGNAVLLKPSSATPYAGGLVGKLFERAGLPKDLVTVLQGDSSTGQALLEAGCDKISFTGSEGVGRHVGLTCSQTFTPHSLELGGKNPIIVCKDADIERAAAAAVAGTYLNAGQVCGGIERVLVDASIADAFTEAVAARASKVRQGVEGEFEVGALYVEEQLKLVEEQVENAVAQGAKVLVGGKRNPDLEGLYYLPTVLTEVTEDMDVVKNETFGPVMTITRFASEDDAVNLVNSTNYGLTATVWSKDVKRARALAVRLQTGCIDINGVPSTYGVAEAPFGGRKASGIGQVNGAIGLRSYCHALPVSIDRSGGKSVLDIFPKSAKADKGFEGFVKFLYGTAIGRFLANLKIFW